MGKSRLKLQTCGICIGNQDLWTVDRTEISEFRIIALSKLFNFFNSTACGSNVKKSPAGMLLQDRLIVLILNSVTQIQVSHFRILIASFRYQRFTACWFTDESPFRQRVQSSKSLYTLRPCSVMSLCVQWWNFASKEPFVASPPNWLSKNRKRGLFHNRSRIQTQLQLEAHHVVQACIKQKTEVPATVTPCPCWWYLLNSVTTTVRYIHRVHTRSLGSQPRMWG